MEFAQFLDRYLDDFLAVASIFFCGAVVCGIIYISYYFFKKSQKRHLWLQRNGKRANGRVIALYEKTKYMRGDENTPGQWMKTEWARYSFPADGAEWIGDFPQSKKQFYHKGDSVEVYYDPADPRRNCTPRQIEEDKKIQLFFRFLLGILAFVTLAAAACMAFR